MNNIKEQFRNGLIVKNPLFIQMLGMCSALAVTTSAMNSLGMGIAVTAVLVCSNLFISILRKIIPNQIRIAAYVVIISGFVCVIELLIKAYLPDLDKSLGIFIPLIVVNCLILARAESFASKNTPIPSIIDGLAMGAGFTFAIFALGAVREIIGAGTIFGFLIFGAGYKPAVMFLLPAGAFITLGCLTALFQFCISKFKTSARKKPESAKEEKTLNVENKTEVSV